MWTPQKGKQNQIQDEFLKDSVVVGYFDNLRSRSKATGKDLDGKITTHLSRGTWYNTRLNLRTTIWKLGLKDSPTVLTDLRDLTESDPKEKRLLEHALAALSNEEPLTAARARITYFKGVMHRGGGISLNVACDNHFKTKHKAIDPLTLRDIRNKMNRDMGITADLAAETGERPQELYGHRLNQFRKLNDHYYAIDSIKFQNKGGLAFHHPNRKDGGSNNQTKPRQRIEYHPSKMARTMERDNSIYDNSIRSPSNGKVPQTEIQNNRTRSRNASKPFQLPRRNQPTRRRKRTLL